MSFDEFLKDTHNQLQQLTAMVSNLQSEVRSLKHGERLSYNLHEAAQIIGISYDSLYAKCKAGRIPYSQDGAGSAIIIDRASLEAYILSTQTSKDLRDIEEQTMARSIRSGKGTLRVAHSRQATGSNTSKP